LSRRTEEIDALALHLDASPPGPPKTPELHHHKKRNQAGLEDRPDEPIKIRNYPVIRLLHRAVPAQNPQGARPERQQQQRTGNQRRWFRDGRQVE